MLENSQNAFLNDLTLQGDVISDSENLSQRKFQKGWTSFNSKLWD